jgi:glucokinase
VTKRVIGIDVGGTTTKGGIVSSTGEIHDRAEIPTDQSAGTKGIIHVVEELLAKADSISAVGVGAAGFIDFPSGSVSFSPNVTYDDPHIRRALEARVDLPVVVDNDANAAAWGERAFGVVKGLQDVALLTLGTGVGSGLIAGGRLIRGSSGAGGEIGHTVVDHHGPPCRCGLRGCLEQMASGTAIARLASEAVERDPDSSILAFSQGEEITAQHVAKAAREMDETARRVLRSAGVWLGIGLSNVVNFLDPEAIVLGGQVVQAGEPYLGAARDTLVAMTQAQKRRAMRLDVSALGADAGIIGAGALALDLLEES